MQIKFRLYNTKGELDSYVVFEPKANIMKRISKYAIGKYAKVITNANINGMVCRAKAGNTIPTITVQEYNKLVVKQNYNGFKRRYTKIFDAWFNQESDLQQVLYVEGMRQVGKTYEILRYSHNHFENIIYFNLINDKYFIEFMKTAQTTDFAWSFSVFCEEHNIIFFNDANTVIIVDEIQEAIDEVFNKLRLLHRELNCRIIVTGSYLGRIITHNNTFFPAGDVNIVTMYSMTLNETAEALGMSLRGTYEIYRKIGGFPSAVKTYKTTKNIDSVRKTLQNLWSIFCAESQKYIKNADKEFYESLLYTLIRKLLCEKQGDILVNSDVDAFLNVCLQDIMTKSTEAHIKIKDVERTLRWLIMSHVIKGIVVNTDGDINSISTKRRYYLTDVGLLSMLLSETNFTESNKEGLLTENFVFAELLKYDVKLHTLVYKDYELDFATIVNGKIVGLEVKTHKGTAKSLNEMLGTKLVDVGYKICAVQGESNVLLWEIDDFAEKLTLRI